MHTTFLDSINIHHQWESFLTHQRKEQIKQIESVVLQDGITPPPEKVLRFLRFPLRSAQVIILGQDPYPQPGAATGRAFEVGNLVSWNQKFKNNSLKNILRALYKAYTGKILKYSELKEKFDNEFPVLPPTKFFQHWEDQGVLLLNTSFTCRPGSPGSHRKSWEDFTGSLLKFIHRENPDATWFLWGNHALEASHGINMKNQIFTMHPMMCYDLPQRKSDFLFGEKNCFRPFTSIIDWTGYGFQKKIAPQPKLF